MMVYDEVYHNYFLMTIWEKNSLFA